MCLTCYNSMGSPRADTEDVRRMTAAAAVLRSARVDRLIREWDIEDIHLDKCLAWPHLPEREWIWFTGMRRLSLDERATALAMIAGYWRP